MADKLTPTEAFDFIREASPRLLKIIREMLEERIGDRVGVVLFLTCRGEDPATGAVQLVTNLRPESAASLCKGYVSDQETKGSAQH